MSEEIQAHAGPPHWRSAPIKTTLMNFIPRTVLSLFLHFTTWKSSSVLQIIITDSYLAEWQKSLVLSSTPLISSPILTLWISGREISSKVYFSSHMGRSWKRLCGSIGKPSNMTLALANQPHPNGHQHTISQDSAKQARKQIQLGICWTEAWFCERKLSCLLKYTKALNRSLDSSFMKQHKGYHCWTRRHIISGREFLLCK